MLRYDHRNEWCYRVGSYRLIADIQDNVDPPVVFFELVSPLIIDIAVNMWYNSDEVIRVANITYNIRIDKEIREQADALYKSMGLSLSAAINLFLTQSVVQGKLPIAEVVALPHYADILLRDAAETDAAIANGSAAIYSTPDALFKAWESEE